jgi:hypothetical protein
MMTLTRPLLVSGATVSLLTALLAQPARGVTDTVTATTHPDCAFPIQSTPAGPTGPSATGYVLNVGGLATVYDPTDSSKAVTPSAFAFDTGTAAAPARTVLASFGQNDDVANAPIVGGQVRSVDNGWTFPASTFVQTTGTAPPGGFAGVRLRSGVLFNIDFRPISITSTTANVTTFRSVDGGATWTQGSMTFTAPAGKHFDPGFTLGLRLNEMPIELADGTIVASYYTKYVEDSGGNAELMQSSDGGNTFTRRGVIAAGSATKAYNEAGIAQLPNGSLIAAVRSTGTGGVQNLRQTSSTDGRTWTAPVDMQMNIDGTGTAVKPGINPQLDLLPNGILMLSSGRDNTGNGNNWVAMSTNGQGTGWVGALTFRNCPRIEDSNGSLWHGSSGNTGLVSVDSNTALQVVDNCHAGYCLFAGDSEFTIDKEYRISRRLVNALTPDIGKIDLGGKLRAGTIAVTGSMTYATAAHPRTGVAGTFDGSTEYWSSAVASGAGSMVIALDKTYQMRKVGLSLRNGRPESARVSFSTDGVTWGSPAVTVTNRTDYAIGYSTLASPVSAKFVKVDVDASSQCESGIGTSCAFLNELELYSTTDSFENDPLNNRPRGWSQLIACWVSTSNLDDSAHALLCSDGSPSAMATAAYLGAATATKTAEFKLKPITVPNAVLLDIQGRNAAGATVAAFHLSVFPDGSLRRWNGSSWLTIAAAGTVPIGSWSTISIAATTSTATVTVDGAVVASGVPVTTAAASLLGMKVASGGTQLAGDAFAIDDVLVN